MEIEITLNVYHVLSLICNKKYGSIIIKKEVPANKSSRPEVFTEEFYQIYKEEFIPILLELFQKTEEEETLPKSLY